MAVWEVLVGAASAIGGGLMGTSWQSRLQDKRDQKKEKGALYLDLLRDAKEANLAEFEDDPESDMWMGSQDPRSWQRSRDYDARLRLFGSPEARDLWRRVTESSAELAHYVRETPLLTEFGGRTVLDPRARDDARYVALHERAKSAREQLTKQVRSELK